MEKNLKTDLLKRYNINLVSEPKIDGEYITVSIAYENGTIGITQKYDADYYNSLDYEGLLAYIKYLVFSYELDEYLCNGVLKFEERRD